MTQGDATEPSGPTRLRSVPHYIVILPASSEPPVEDLRTRLRETLRSRATALSWRDRLSVPVSIVWIDGNLTVRPEAQSLARAAEPDAFPHILSALGSADPVLRRRATSAMHDRLALHLAGERLKGVDPAAVLAHTALGQPVVCTRHGARIPDLHVSFTHDGDAHLCALARHPELRGVGIDVVHLARLRGRSDGYLRRFAGHFMSTEEFAAFDSASRNETGESLLQRAAAHFSFMESASKALGTGLKIGAGMGKKESLPKQAIGVSGLEPEIEFLLRPEAHARCAELRAARLEGHWAADEEYGVSLVLLWARAIPETHTHRRS